MTVLKPAEEPAYFNKTLACPNEQCQTNRDDAWVPSANWTVKFGEALAPNERMLRCGVCQTTTHAYVTGWDARRWFTDEAEYRRYCLHRPLNDLPKGSSTWLYAKDGLGVQVERGDTGLFYYPMVQGQYAGSVESSAEVAWAVCVVHANKLGISV